MEESLVALGVGGRLPRGQAGVELHGDQQSIFHRVLGRPGMDGHAGDLYAPAGGVEVFIFDAALQVTVQRIGELRAEIRHIEVTGPLPNFLIRGKGYADLAVGQIFGNQLLAQGQDFGNTRLVVSAQQG